MGTKVIKDALIVIGRLSYPSATAPSNRVHLYCKALKNEKGFPFVINLHSTFIDQQPFNYLGRHEGIPFYYAQKTIMHEKRFLIRNIKKIKGFINTFIVLKKLKKNHDFKVLFYATEIIDEFFLFIFLKIIRVSIVRDCSEIPKFIMHEKKSKQFHHTFLRLKLKMYDRLIVISDFLNSFYSEIFPKNNIFQIPILVDMKRFSKKPEIINHKKNIITYVGFMGGNKDGLENLINSMVSINEQNKNVLLQLVGSAPKEDMCRLRNKVEGLNLSNSIAFLGRRSADEIPSLLFNSDLLVLARPNNNQARAGFPTKLGEYLASGKPIVITKTGEIPKYLKDNVSAYLAEPDDISHFVEKVLFALSDSHAAEIGRNGLEIANSNFNYQLYGKEILKIVQS
jgi:glycosyltransferase involved in cell wall biosynthesis